MGKRQPSGSRLQHKQPSSIKDPDALLARLANGHPALPSDRGHLPMRNPPALVIDCRGTSADRDGRPDGAIGLDADLSGPHKTTSGAD
jgi:hypothetical protein